MFRQTKSASRRKNTLMRKIFQFTTKFNRINSKFKNGIAFLVVLMTYGDMISVILFFAIAITNPDADGTVAFITKNFFDLHIDFAKKHKKCNTNFFIFQSDIDLQKLAWSYPIFTNFSKTHLNKTSINFCKNCKHFLCFNLKQLLIQRF